MEVEEETVKAFESPALRLDDILRPYKNHQRQNEDETKSFPLRNMPTFQHETKVL